jgi:hypothetical protein
LVDDTYNTLYTVKYWTNMLDGGVGWRCWMEVLDGGVGWRCWMEVLDGGVGWRCWMEVLPISAGRYDSEEPKQGK